MTNKNLIIAFSALLLVPGSYAFAATSSSTPAHQTVNTACVQTAVDTREAALSDAFAAFSSAESSALTARKTALHDAWGLSSSASRRTARNKAWSDFRSANKTAFSALRSARKAAWSTFATASASCKVPVVEASGEEGTGSLGL